MKKMLKLYGIKPEEGPHVHGGAFEGAHAWKNLIGAPAPYEKEVGPVNYLALNDDAMLATVAKGTGSLSRDHTKRALVSLVEDGYAATRPNPKRKDSVLYYLTDKGRRMYADFDYSEIGSSSETAPLARIAELYYRRRGWFVCIARQDGRGGGDYCPDMVAYDYSRALPVSVEIESRAEVKSHPEHVMHNMTKWPELGCKECHVWTTSETAVRVRDGLKRLGDRVKLFMVDLDAGTATLEGSLVYGPGDGPAGR